MASARGTLLLVSASTWSALGLGMRAALRAPSLLMVATSPSAAAPVGIEPQRHTVALVRMQDPMIAPPPRAVHPASAYADLRTPAPQVALGCPKNTVDAEVMLGDLQRNGLRVVSEPCDAEVVIVNTCAFVEDAKRESISAIMSAARLKEDRSTPVRALYVTGCMAQRYADELAEELPEVDAIVGFESYAQIPEQVRRPETSPPAHHAGLGGRLPTTSYTPSPPPPLPPACAVGAPPSLLRRLRQHFRHSR